MGSEPRDLSSAQTVLMKTVFPILWIGAFTVATISLFLSPESWHGSDGPPDSGLKWFFLIMTIVGTVFIWRTGMRLKRVRMDGKALYLSNFSNEIIVPLVNVAEVTENRWLNMHPVTIHFHSETEFGSQVTFMPRIRWFAFWSSHPVVEEIRLAVRRATGRGQA